MRILLAFIALFCSLSLHAEDKLVIRVTIDSAVVSDGNKVNSNYTSAVLVGLNESNDINFDKFYNAKIITRSTDNKNVNILFSLNQIIDDKLYYIGEQPLVIPIGETKDFELVNKVGRYKITLNTAYGNPDLIAK